MKFLWWKIILKSHLPFRLQKGENRAGNIKDWQSNCMLFAAHLQPAALWRRTLANMEFLLHTLVLFILLLQTPHGPSVSESALPSPKDLKWFSLDGPDIHSSTPSLLDLIFLFGLFSSACVLLYSRVPFLAYFLSLYLSLNSHIYFYFCLWHLSFKLICSAAYVYLKYSLVFYPKQTSSKLSSLCCPSHICSCPGGNGSAYLAVSWVNTAEKNKKPHFSIYPILLYPHFPKTSKFWPLMFPWFVLFLLLGCRCHDLGPGFLFV